MRLSPTVNETLVSLYLKTLSHQATLLKLLRVHSRGGVEDTRLEAKAKDTKKIRGQGQTLSRPRTGMLEATAKDQGHKRKCSPKKKGLHKNFSSDLHKKTFFQKIFQALHKIFTIPKIVLSSSRGQANFRGLEASRPRTSSRTPPLVQRCA